MPSGSLTSADSDAHISAEMKRSASPASMLNDAQADSAVAAEELSVDVSASPLQNGQLATSDEYADDEDEAKSQSPNHLSAPVVPSSPLSGQGGEARPLKRRSSHAGFSEQDDAHREEFLRVTRMEGYVFSWPREILYWIACPCTAFVVWLMHLWVRRQACTQDAQGMRTVTAILHVCALRVLMLIRTFDAFCNALYLCGLRSSRSA